jgi:hypothetical protein
MKYLNKSFTVSYGSKKYRDNWDEIFNPIMDKQVYYARWHNRSGDRIRWSLHLTGKEAVAFRREYVKKNSDMYIVSCGWALTSDYIYDKVSNCAGMFVNRKDFEFK